jgi:hypothetical protein
MSSPVMRAKMKCSSVEPSGDGEILRFHAVAKSDGYPADGADENNSYARWSPSADLSINVQNPALKGKIKSGDSFYVDFTPADGLPRQ